SRMTWLRLMLVPWRGGIDALGGVYIRGVWEPEQLLLPQTFLVNVSTTALLSRGDPTSVICWALWLGWRVPFVPLAPPPAYVRALSRPSWRWADALRDRIACRFGSSLEVPAAMP